MAVTTPLVDQAMSAWTQAQIAQYRERQPHYQAYARLLREILEHAVAAVAPEAIVQTRPKGVASFAEKIQRLRHKYQDPVNQLTDLCGARVIVRTRADVQRVCQFVAQHFVIDHANSQDVSARLTTREFGYRSWHFIIQLPREAAWLNELGLTIPEEVYPLKAEIQIRTFLEHAWSVMSHDIAYKGAFELPANLARDFHSLAAVLENADDDFARIEQAIAIFQSSYGSYLPREAMERELALLAIVQAQVPTAETAQRIGKLAMCLEDWETTITALTPYAEGPHAALIRDLGVALCKQGQIIDDEAMVARGIDLLRRACTLSACHDIDAMTILARYLSKTDPAQAQGYYDLAFQHDPLDPYVLESSISHQWLSQGQAFSVQLVAPLLRQSIARCRAQAAAKVNLPWAYYSIGQFSLWLGDLTESLAAYAKAIQVTPSAWMLHSQCQALERQQPLASYLPGLALVQRLLLLGRACRFGDAQALDTLRALATPGTPVLRPPVVIISGGCDPRVAAEMQRYLPLLRTAFDGFTGTLISGGTTDGISGLVGELQAAYPAQLHTVGYLPATLPAEATPDTRYRELRATTGTGFSALEPLQNWIDLLASGVEPASVSVLGINGGQIARSELQIALALGANVGVLSDSGRSAAELLDDPVWQDSPRLLALPHDAASVAAFLGTWQSTLSPGEIDRLAEAIHEHHRQSLLRDLQSPATGKDPAYWPWTLLERSKVGHALKHSSVAHVAHLEEKLRHLGLTLRRVTGRPPAAFTFTPEEVEHLAELEHARWTLERLREGWRYGATKDTANKISPYLIPWNQLSDTVKQWDRDLITGLPTILAAVGFAIER